MSRWHFITSGPLGVAVLLCAGSAARPAVAQSKSSTILVLKDPTPRPVDLDKIYRNAETTGKPLNGQQLAAYNQKRYELITEASSQMTSLAGKLQQGIANHSSGMPLAPEIQIATYIEVLANNIHTAISPKENLPAKEKATPLRRYRSIPQTSMPARTSL